MVYKYYLTRQLSTISVSVSESTPLFVSTKKPQSTFLKRHKSSIMLCFYLFLYTNFLFFGAAVFNVLEAPQEKVIIARLRKIREEFLINHPNVSDADLEALIDEIIFANNRGVSAVQNVSGEPNWSFGQSLFFSSTVITTIGYGHVTPLSRAGKIFCMLYAVTGIPLTLVLLTAFVERLLVPTVWFLQFLNSRLGHIYEPLKIRLFHLFCIVVLLIVFFVLIPAAAFATVEPNWDYFDSVYYCFISLTTIGLGDYIPGDAPAQPNRPIYKIGTTCYLFLGITFMMLTLAVYYDIPQLNIGTLFTTNKNSDSEKVHLAGPSQNTKYGADSLYEGSTKEEENTHRQVVRVRSRRNDSPSPEEGPKDFLPP